MNLSEAKAIVGDILDADGLHYRNNGSHELDGYTTWGYGDETMLLDGDYTPEQLEALAWIMRNVTALVEKEPGK